MAAKSTVFNKDWCDDHLHPEFKWVREVENDIHRAERILYKTNFSLSNIGIQDHAGEHVTGKKKIHQYKHRLDLLLNRNLLQVQPLES